MMKLQRLSIVAALGFVGAGAVIGPAAGATNATPQVIAVPRIANARDAGRLPGGTTVRLAVAMRLRNEQGLDALVGAQSMRGAAFYHHFLTAAQLRDSFGATPVDYNRTVLELRRAGFSIERLDPLRTIVDVAAPAVVVERYFSTTLHGISMAGARGPSYMNATPARIPAALNATVKAVTGFTRAPLYATVYSAAKASAKKRAPQPQTTPTATPGPTPQFGPDGGYGPASVTGAFDYPVRHGYFGNGATVADMIDGTFSDSLDIAPYLAEFNVKRTGPPTTFIPVNGGCSFCFDGSQAAIDAEAVIGTAPGVAYDVYVLPGLFNIDIVDGLRQIVSDNRVDVANISFAGCETAIGETALVEDQYFKMGSAEGITFEVVSFNGSHPCFPNPPTPSVQSPSDSPNVFTVGGADSFVDQYGNITSPPIANTGSGGGVSVLFDKPAFQNGVRGVLNGGRNVPDVAGPAAIDTVGPSAYYSGFGGWIGGFPFIDNAFIGGAVAEMAQIQGVRLGLLDSSVYSLFKTGGYGRKTAPYFRDVTLGCNGFSGYGPYCAHGGYDQVTGIGAPDVYNLARNLKI